MAVVGRQQPPIGYVHLVLYPQQPNAHPGSEFYLEIPVSFIEGHFRSHLKFLSYLGWCILGIHGNLLDNQRQQVNCDGQLQDRGTYYYSVKETDDLFKYAVDVEAVKVGSEYKSSDSSQRDPDFRKLLFLRDGGCIFTCSNDISVVGMHIIPHSKGDEWVQHIVANRPSDEPVHDIGIDDIQNGLLCIPQIHAHFDSQNAMILKTPNAILGTDDVLPSKQRPFPLHEGCSHPLDCRYTYQQIDQPTGHLDNFDNLVLLDNNDATFLEPSILPKPSALLLNYNYGVTAVRRWGQNTAIISERAAAFRPKAPTPAMGPAKTSREENRKNFAKKRKRLETGCLSENEGEEKGTKVSDSRDEAQEWDEHDIMLFFWRNTKIVRERLRDEAHNLSTRIEDWRRSVAD